MYMFKILFQQSNDASATSATLHIRSTSVDMSKGDGANRYTDGEGQKKNRAETGKG